MERDYEKAHRAHRAESDAKSNKEMADAYAAVPVRLVGIATADLFIGDDIQALAKNLLPLLPTSGHFSSRRDNIVDFLQFAQGSLGGGASTRAAYWNALESGWPLSDKVKWLPERVQSVHFVLRTLTTGIVMFAVFVVPSERYVDLAEDVFTNSHATPVRREGGKTTEYTVEAAKTMALKEGLEAILNFGIFPAGAGLLKGQRYPAGSLVVWDLAEIPATDNREWAEVRRVLNMEDWNRWDGKEERLYPGLPTSPFASFWERESGGWTLLTTQVRHSDGRRPDADALDSYRQHVLDTIDEWFAWVVAVQAAAQIGKQADRLRANLDRERMGPLRFLRVGSLEPLVDSLQRCQYHLSRLKQATSPDEQRYVHFPEMVEGELMVQRRRPTTKPGSSDQAASYTPTTFGDALSSWIIAVIEAGLQEVRLSLERATTLVQLRTNAAMRAWTVALAILTAAVLVLTVIAVTSQHR